MHCPVRQNTGMIRIFSIIENTTISMCNHPHSMIHHTHCHETGAPKSLPMHGIKCYKQNLSHCYKLLVSLYKDSLKNISSLDTYLFTTKHRCIVKFLLLFILHFDVGMLF